MSTSRVPVRFVGGGGERLGGPGLCSRAVDEDEGGKRGKKDKKKGPQGNKAKVMDDEEAEPHAEEEPSPPPEPAPAPAPAPVLLSKS
jgi:hypothetical protein